MNQQELVGAVAAAANVEPHLAQEALAEEKNDANAAVSLLLKRQEEAELVAMQEGKAEQAQHNPAIPAVLELWVVPPSLTLPGSCSGGPALQYIQYRPALQYQFQVSITQWWRAAIWPCGGLDQTARSDYDYKLKYKYLE
jgi:hypothetical protein